jgi:hypothetical protein
LLLFVWSPDIILVTLPSYHEVALLASAVDYTAISIHVQCHADGGRSQSEGV